MRRPGSDECNAYYNSYIEKLPDGDISEILGHSWEQTRSFLSTVDEERSQHRYAQGKWSIREVVGHLLDAERIFTCRALRFARNDATELPGFDENEYVVHSNYDERRLSDLIQEFDHLRRANIHLFASFDETVGELGGNANGDPITVRAIPWIIAGHELHHREVMQERYL